MQILCNVTSTLVHINAIFEFKFKFDYLKKKKNISMIAAPDATVCDGETQFTCADGEKCISLLQACDISADCPDASDEGTNYCCKYEDI